MAEKPQTYPQQIQTLKDQLATANADRNRLEEQVSLIPDLQEEVTVLRGQVQASTKLDSSELGNHKAQLTDLKAQADSNAAESRRYSKQLSDSLRYVQQLEEQLDILGKERFKWIDADKKAQLTEEALKTSNLHVTALTQRIADVAAEKDRIIELQSRELQTLRMKTVSQDKILFQVRDALNSAPDVIGSLKYIVGINGSSTE